MCGSVTLLVTGGIGVCNSMVMLGCVCVLVFVVVCVQRCEQ